MGTRVLLGLQESSFGLREADLEDSKLERRREQVFGSHKKMIQCIIYHIPSVNLLH